MKFNFGLKQHHKLVKKKKHLSIMYNIIMIPNLIVLQTKQTKSIRSILKGGTKMKKLVLLAVVFILYHKFLIVILS